MRIPVPALVLLIVATACSGSSSTETSPGQGGTTPQPTIDSAGSTTSSVATTVLEEGTTTTLPGPVATTSPGEAPPAAVCDGYLDFLAAFDRRQELDALRRLDIAIGLPRAPSQSEALSVLRDRAPGSAMSAAEARATLETDFGPGCGEPGPGYAGRFNQLFTPGVVVAGEAGVRLLDGTELIPSDPAGPYVDAFGTRTGGTAALITIGGLEIVEYRADSQDLPRDLALEGDLLLHGTASIDGTEYVVVTTWEAGGEFGEETQFLDLLPLDGGDPTRVGIVGSVTAAAETVSFADGSFLVTESVLGGSRLYALGLDGASLQVPGLPVVIEGAPGVATQPLQRARAAPDRERVAYLSVTPGVGSGGIDVLRTELVIQRLTDGSEEVRIEIGGRDQVFTSLDYDGHWAIAASRGMVVVVDTWDTADPEATIRTLSVSGVEAARFLDGALLLGS